MNDWNENGKIDAMDSYIDYKLFGGDKHIRHGRKKNSGTGRGVLIYMFLRCVDLYVFHDCFYGGAAGDRIDNAGRADMVDF